MVEFIGKNYIKKEVLKTKNAIDELLNDELLQDKIVKTKEVCIEALNKGNKIIFCGNGGSAADSQHLAAELVSRFWYNRPGLSAIALTVDTSAITAIGNDYGYDRIFARQLEAVGKEGDILFGFSTSGYSKNVLVAFEEAKKLNITTIGMLGRDGKAIGKLSDIELNMTSNETPHIQECHITVGHIICGMIEAEIFPQN
jgi:D-sedoheptulose 7-phosphate isomerase